MSKLDSVFIAEINGVEKILSKDISTGDTVIGHKVTAVDNHWIDGCVANNKLGTNAYLIFKDSISIGRTDREETSNITWYKEIGNLIRK